VGCAGTHRSRDCASARPGFHFDRSGNLAGINEHLHRGAWDRRQLLWPQKKSRRPIGVCHQGFASRKDASFRHTCGSAPAATTKWDVHANCLLIGSFTTFILSSGDPTSRCDVYAEYPGFSSGQVPAPRMDALSAVSFTTHSTSTACPNIISLHPQRRVAPPPDAAAVQRAKLRTRRKHLMRSTEAYGR